MTPIYKVGAPERLHPSDPLHVGRFYPHLQRRHFRLMRDRQELILYLARIHADAVNSGIPLGLCEIPMRLLTLRDWVYDYRTVFDYFFEVKQLGFNLTETHEISTVVPRRLPTPLVLPDKLVYIPPEKSRSTSAVFSKVFIQHQNRDVILSKLSATRRFDLLPPVEWLLEQEEIDFQFAPAGRLQQRDTSIYPVAAVETWPSWLREALFGPGIDIDSAYTQFLMSHVGEVYADRSHLPSLLYPDLIRSLNDKGNWRRELCEDVLGLEHTDENISVVKRLCMCVANGSRVSPAILESGRSVTRDIIVERIPDISQDRLRKIGKRLERISKQYSAARRVICAVEMGVKPSRKNQKMVFSSYFEWERFARYAIWEEVDRHGIMVHDGIDGVPLKYTQDLRQLIEKLNLRLS